MRGSLTHRVIHRDLGYQTIGVTLYRGIKKLLARQGIRYLVAGGWNTLFGLGSSFFFYWLLQPRIHYMTILIFTNILAVTMAYVTYKVFVFRTKGNFLREYLKFYCVYGVGILFGLAATPFCIEVLGLNFYCSQSLILMITVVSSFVGHKRFSFRRRAEIHPFQ